MVNKPCYRIVDLVRETRSDHQLTASPVHVRADSELALASLLGLAPARGSVQVPQVRAGFLLALVFALALALALLSVDAVL